MAKTPKDKDKLETTKDGSTVDSSPGGLILVDESQPKQVPSMPVAVGNSTDDLIAMAVRRGDSTEKINQLMDLRDRNDAKIGKDAFTVAMSMFKSEHLHIARKNKADFGQGKAKYSYATLDNICEIAVPVMSQYGLSHNWLISQEGTKIIVTCVLTHSLGHSEKVTLSGEPDTTGNKNALQAIGSATEYLRRYTFLAITGLSTGDVDNDNNPKAGETVSDEKVQEFVGKLGKCTTVEACDKVLADASKVCMALNDLKSYKIIGTSYNKVKDLIEDPPE